MQKVNPLKRREKVYIKGKGYTTMRSFVVPESKRIKLSKKAFSSGRS